MATRKICTMQEVGSGKSKELVGRFVNTNASSPVEIAMVPTGAMKPEYELVLRQAENKVRITGMFKQKDSDDNTVFSGNVRPSVFYRVSYVQGKWILTEEFPDSMVSLSIFSQAIRMDKEISDTSMLDGIKASNAGRELRKRRIAKAKR